MHFIVSKSCGMKCGVVALATAVMSGCGGSGGSGSVGVSHPTKRTANFVASLLAGYGQTVACNSFTGYGQRLLTHGGVVFDPTLGLWYTIQIAPDGTFEKMYQDKAKTMPAGSLAYTVNDAALTLSGTFSVNLGPYGGLNGTYLQSLQSVGWNGSIAFTNSAVGTTDSQFEIKTSSTGGYVGKATNGVALQSGYTQTEVVAWPGDGTFTATTTDSNACKSSFNFTATLSGSGKVTGNAPGLPATITWNTGGNGAVTYADGSTAQFAAWQLTSG
jgi:hypothetical protein